jgi:hypothetical protein
MIKTIKWNFDNSLSMHGNIDFEIKWKPDKPDNFKFSIIFEVFNSQLKFIVQAFGVCV